MTRRHVDIGLLAVQRGMITPATFGDAMRHLAETGGELSDEELWRERLTAPQLVELRAAISRPPKIDATALRHTELKGGGATPTGGTAAQARRYQPLRGIAEGGVGEVYECLDVEFGRRVALKLLRGDCADDEHKIAMLSHEARITGNLEHPNIIPVYDLGAHSDGRPYYVMRLVEQPTLADAIDRLRAGDAGAQAEYGLHRLLRTFIQVCQAVDYAHSRGVLHCDLKPANVLLGSFGEVLVADWGLASEIDRGMRFRGGTLGYMAPEQILAAMNRDAPLDPRTDVFSLGAILYEILTLTPVYGEMSLATAMGFVDRGVDHWPAPEDPRRVASEARPVPEELAEICLKAMQPLAADRFTTARDMASAVEAFLEGTRERERRLARAQRLVEQGEQLAQAYHDFIDSRPDTVDEMSALRERIATWDPSEHKQELWDIEERLAVTDALSIRTLQAAVANFEQALDEHAGFLPARRGLAGLYRGELRRAQERRDAYGVIYFQELVRAYEEGDPARGNDLSTVELTGSPGGEVTLAQLEERGRRLVPARERTLGTTPIEKLELAPGSYLVTVRAEGIAPVRAPLFVRVGTGMRLHLDLDQARGLHDGEILIPGGPALLQRDEGGLERGQLFEVDVASFVIAERPVSFAEYLEFLTERTLEDPKIADAFLPRSVDGLALWRWTGTTFEPSAITRWGDNRDEILRFPAFGIDALSAEVYASWKGARTGVPYRLPTETEWEKAARGTDGRAYPWGDHFDASFCKMRESRPGLPRPEPIGAFAHDVSPYGVRDLAGGVAEWVVPLGGARLTLGGVLILATRGGAWPDSPADCRAGARRTYLAVERSARIGFRLARTIK